MDENLVSKFCVICSDYPGTLYTYDCSVNARASTANAKDEKVYVYSDLV